MQRHASRAVSGSVAVAVASKRTLVHQHGVSNEPLRAGAQWFG